MAEEEKVTERYVGVRSLNSLVGHIKYNNYKQDLEIEKKLDAGDEMSILDIDKIWQSI